MNRRRFRTIVLSAACGALVLWVAPRVLGASKSVDLDKKTANGAESAVSLDILTTYPPKVQNRVTNRAVGDSYSFKYVSAGPGGFSSQLAPGTAAGVGAQWVWQTAQTIYSFTGSSCANDICFTRLAGPDPAPTNTPAWRVPGRTLVPNNVTPSSASLTSSLLTFFSPPQLLVEVTSAVTPLASGQLGYTTTYTNQTSSSVVIEIGAAPLGCCPDSDQLNCDGTCVDYLTDADNCGECGFSCAESCGDSVEPYCNYGYCSCGDYGGSIANPDATVPKSGTRKGSSRAFGRAVLTETSVPLGEGVQDPAPVCETCASTETIEPGESFTQCSTSGFLPKEVPSVLTVCGNDIPDGETTCGNSDPASSGTFMQFVPDSDRPYPYPGVFLSVYQVTVTDPNGNGVLEPGETGTVFIYVLNAGTDPVVNPVGTLSSPPVDLTDDGEDNPTSIVISPAVSPYAPDLPGVPAAVPGGDCSGPALPPQPSVNAHAFGVTIPGDHPGDVARPFALEVTSAGSFGAIALELPLSLGIGSAEADLSVSLSDSSDPASAGSVLDYNVAFANHGPKDAVNARITVTLPAGEELVTVSAPGGWSCSSDDASGTDVVTCDRANFPAGTSDSFPVRARLDSCTGAVQRSVTAAIGSDTPDGQPDDNTDTETTEVQDLHPTVQITQPSADQTGSPPVSLPITVRFSSQAGDSPVVREQVSLDSCVLWDGLTEGDRDGLLSDEFIQTNKYILCQAMARCGLQILNYPRIRVTATDACGGNGQDDVIIRKRLLKTEVCAR